MTFTTGFITFITGFMTFITGFMTFITGFMTFITGFMTFITRFTTFTTGFTTLLIKKIPKRLTLVFFIGLFLGCRWRFGCWATGTPCKKLSKFGYFLAIALCVGTGFIFSIIIVRKCCLIVVKIL